jgi:hypothetical protein
MTPTFIRLDSMRIVLRYATTNPTAVSKTVTIGVAWDAKFNSDESPPFATLPAWSGFVMGPDSDYRLTFVCRHSPHVTDVDSYWYGSAGARTSHYWTQISSTYLSGIDSGLAFSWYNRTLLPGESKNFSVLLVSRDLTNTSLVLNLSGTVIPPYQSFDAAITVIGQVTYEGGALVTLTVIARFSDSTAADTVTVASHLRSGDSFNQSILLPCRPQSSQISFFAVSEDGEVSEPIVFDTTVVCPTPSPTLTPLSTRTAFPFVPIEVTAYSGRLQFSGFYEGNRFTPANTGYAMHFRVDGSTYSVSLSSFPWAILGVRVTHNSTLFDEGTTIESYTMTNTRYQYKATVGFSLYGLLDAAEMSIEPLPLLTGVVFSSPACALTFFVRHHELGSNFDKVFLGRSSSFGFDDGYASDRTS